MPRYLTILFITFASHLLAQDSCYTYDFKYTIEYDSILTLLYFEDGTLALRRKVNKRGVSRSKQWNSCGILIQKTKHFPKRFSKMDYHKYWRLSFHPNGAIKCKTVMRFVKEYYRARGRKKCYNESGKRIRT